MFLFSVVGSGKWRLSNWSGGCWASLGFFFAVSSAAWHTVPEKMIFGSGKSCLIVGEWRLLGFAGTGKLPGKKWFLGWENHVVTLESGGCWDLLGFFFAVSILLLARLPGKESGGCWDLLGFLLLRCLLLFGRVPVKKMIFGWGKWFFWNWRLAAAGICWDFFFCGVYCCLASCPAKKWFLGLENHFCEIGEWRLVICWDFSFFALSIAAWQTALGRGNHSVKLESGDCWDLPGFLLLRCPGKKWFLGRENHVSEAIAGICWDFSLFALSTATWQTARKKMIFGSGKSFFWNWRVAIAGICWDFFFCGVDCCLAGCPEKKNDFWVGKIIFLKLETSDCWALMGFLLLRCLLSKRLVVLAYMGWVIVFFSSLSFWGGGGTWWHGPSTC